MAQVKDPRTARLIVDLESRLAAEQLPRDHARKILSLAKSDGNWFSRDEYGPGHFTASAFALSSEGRSLLLIRHRKIHIWCQPGGHIEQGDRSVQAAALRELTEETNLVDVELVDPLFDVDVHEIPSIHETPAHFHHDLRVLVRARNDTIFANEEVADARWFSLEDIAHSGPILADGLGTDASVRRVALRLLEATPLSPTAE